MVSPVSRTLKKNTLPVSVRRNALKRRTFRDIVEHHPRGDGKFGFTVRELCTTMHISAASLTHARTNPGHLMVEKIVALTRRFFHPHHPQTRAYRLRIPVLLLPTGSRPTEASCAACSRRKAAAHQGTSASSASLPKS